MDTIRRRSKIALDKHKSWRSPTDQSAPGRKEGVAGVATRIVKRGVAGGRDANRQDGGRGSKTKYRVKRGVVPRSRRRGEDRSKSPRRARAVLAHAPRKIRRGQPRRLERLLAFRVGPRREGVQIEARRALEEHGLLRDHRDRAPESV